MRKKELKDKLIKAETYSEIIQLMNEYEDIIDIDLVEQPNYKDLIDSRHNNAVLSISDFEDILNYFDYIIEIYGTYTSEENIELAASYCQKLNLLQTDKGIEAVLIEILDDLDFDFPPDFRLFLAKFKSNFDNIKNKNEVDLEQFDKIGEEFNIPTGVEYNQEFIDLSNKILSKLV